MWARSGSARCSRTSHRRSTWSSSIRAWAPVAGCSWSRRATTVSSAPTTALDPDPTYYATHPADPESATFHGRDVFAPLAARVHEEGLAAVVAADQFEQVTDVVRIELPEPSIGADEATGEVLAVDDFGNVITNVPGSFLDGQGDRILVDGRETPVVRSYGALPPGEELVTVGSHGNVELAVNRGRGDQAFGVAPGTTLYLAGIDD